LGTQILAGFLSYGFSGLSSADGSKRNVRIDAEAGLGGGVDVEQVGDGWGEGCSVEDSGMTEDVHEEGVGAVAGVELHPLPVFAGSGTAGCGVDFGEAMLPCGVGADVGVGGGVEVAVAALFVVAEDDDRGWAGGCVVEEVLRACEMVGAFAEIAAEEGGGP